MLYLDFQNVYINTCFLQVGDLLRLLPEAPETASRVLTGVFELGAARSAAHQDAAGVFALIMYVVILHHFFLPFVFQIRCA